MNISWGYKIIIGFTAFLTLIIFLVYGSMRTRIDMASDRYYADELEYQKVLDNAANATAPDARIHVKQTTDSIIIQFPSAHAGSLSGTVQLYFAADSRNDKSIELDADSDAVQRISTNSLAKGNYTLKLNWSDRSKNFYHEEKVWIR